MADVYRQETRYNILNEDEKTVARLILEEIHPRRNEDRSSLLSLLTIQPVRGYTKEEMALFNLCLENQFEPCDGEIVPRTLIAVEHNPGSYSAKLTIDLNPTMRADTATNIILRYMLQIMKMNENHIKQDVDTEFLHDFRVAVRRTRSALSQVKSVFPEEDTERFKEDFKFIGKLSNQLRDLDVYLLAEEDYKAQLPDFLKEDIHPMFEYLQSKRAEALQTVITGLESDEYQHIIQDWEQFLEEPPREDETAVNAAIPILILAKQRIYKRYKRIIHTGNIILVDNKDEFLHDLRIECKKLRYLMEFFASLFPPEEISRLIRQLKDLQSNLGDFNDFCVQEEYLLHVGREMPLRTKAARDALIAIGCLVGTLHQRREQVKSEFGDTFKHFAAKENKALFTELFDPKKDKSPKQKGDSA
jgi:CHAD domain-containing protein